MAIRSLRPEEEAREIPLHAINSLHRQGLAGHPEESEQSEF
jgi:hypothetical protein